MADRAAKNEFPKPPDNFRWRYYGLFYVAPNQDSYMCRLRIPNGILSAAQFEGVARIAEDFGGGYAHVTTRANLQIREIAAIDLSTGGPRAGRRPEVDGLVRSSAAYDPMIDARARSAYRERLIDLEDEIVEAVALGDEGRASSLRTESDFLSRELAGAVGLLGRGIPVLAKVARAVWAATGPRVARKTGASAGSSRRASKAAP